MKKLIIIVLIAILGYHAYSYFIDNQPVSFLSNNEIKRGNHKILTSQSREFTLDLRVFGYNKNTANARGPALSFAFTDYFLIAMPVKQNKALFKKYLCEGRSVNQSSVIAVFAEDKETKNKIRKFARLKAGCVRITGKNLRITKYTYKDKDYTKGWNASSGNKFKSDPYKLFLVSDIKRISCKP